MAIHEPQPQEVIRAYELLDSLTTIKFDLWSLDARLHGLATAHPTDATIANLAADAQRMADVFEQWQLEQERPEHEQRGADVLTPGDDCPACGRPCYQCGDCWMRDR